MKKYYLIEDFDPALVYHDGQPVALNPMPLHLLSQRHISYLIMEDFYDEKDLRKNEEVYFLKQLAWIDELDIFLQCRIHYAGRYKLALARAFYNRIKYFADTIVIQSFILDAIIRKIGRGGCVVYVKAKKEKKQPRTFHHFKQDIDSLYFEDLLPLICQKHGVSYAFHVFERADMPEVKRTRGNNFINLIKSNPILKSMIKCSVHFFKYEKYRRLFCCGRPYLKVLFLHSGSLYLDPIVKDVMGQKGQAFIRVEDVIYDANGFTDKACWDLKLLKDDSENLGIQKDCIRAAEQFVSEGKQLLSWMSEQCGIDVSEFVLPYFRAFIESNCYETLWVARSFLEFYGREKIDYVISHTNSDLMSKGAILAAQISGTVKTVGIKHCADVFIDRVMALTEVEPFDYYFTNEDFSEELFNRFIKEYPLKPCAIYQSSHFLKTIGAHCTARKIKRPALTKRILYIPSKLGSVHIRYFNCMVYPVLWYLEFQRKLFRYFYEKRDKCEFVFKQSMGRATYVDHMVIPYIRENGFSNIKVDTRSVAEALTETDAVLLDRPTTALFEALMSKQPVLCLYPDFIQGMINREFVDYFGKSVRCFSTPEQAFTIIDEFLAGQSSEYTPEIPLREDELVKTLIRHKSVRQTQFQPSSHR